MKFDLLKIKEKTSTQLIFFGGFLMVLFLIFLMLWFYANFLISQDVFLDSVPAQSVIYWHSISNQSSNSVWLRDLTRHFLLGEASDQAEILFEHIAPKTKEMSLAILPGFEDFIFWARLDVSDFNHLKEKIENSKFSYIFENEGKIIITNTKFGLKEVLAVLNERNFSLADQKTRLIAFNRAFRRFPIQFYINGNFKFGDFYPLELESDFWETNQLKVIQKNREGVYAAKDYYYFMTADNPYLVEKGENILKNDLAVVLPEIKERVLPDGTIVREIIANPESFVFEVTKISGEEVKDLKVPVINEEFFIFKTNKGVTFSNSRDLLANHLVHLDLQRKYYGKNLLDFLLDWAKWVTVDFEGAVFGVSVDKL